jgi:hemoglobin-like flavoprotein
MATQTVKQSLLRIASTWPKDKIRPNHQFSDAVSKIAESHQAWSAAGKSHEIKDGEALVGALDRLLQNRAIRQVLHEYAARDPRNSRF